jgi:hypothetical protein
LRQSGQTIVSGSSACAGAPGKGRSFPGAHEHLKSAGYGARPKGCDLSMRKLLSPGDVVAIADKLAKDLGISLPAKEKLIKDFSQENPLPVVISASGYTLWLDRYYIAYSRAEKGTIRYVYVSRTHILEEYRNFQDMKVRGVDESLPPEIGSAFKAAETEMHRTGKEFYVFPKLKRELKLA